MKSNLSLLILLIISSISFGQNLPKLKLKENISNEIPEKLETNEIAVIIERFGGFTAHGNWTNYYIFKNKKRIIAYNKLISTIDLKNNESSKETINKIELTAEQKKHLIESLRSELISDFLKYSQKNFRNNNDDNTINNYPPIIKCIIKDAHGYSITFIQNGKGNSYKYYAPYYFLNNCNDENINKVMLGKYVKLLEMWKLKE